MVPSKNSGAVFSLCLYVKPPCNLFILLYGVSWAAFVWRNGMFYWCRPDDARDMPRGVPNTMQLLRVTYLSVPLCGAFFLKKRDVCLLYMSLGKNS